MSSSHPKCLHCGEEFRSHSALYTHMGSSCPRLQRELDRRQQQKAEREERIRKQQGLEDRKQRLRDRRMDIDSRLAARGNGGNKVNWQCSVCTFLNQNNERVCEVCQAPKPGSSSSSSNANSWGDSVLNSGATSSDGDRDMERAIERSLRGSDFFEREKRAADEALKADGDSASASASASYDSDDVAIDVDDSVVDPLDGLEPGVGWRCVHCLAMNEYLCGCCAQRCVSFSSHQELVAMRDCVVKLRQESYEARRLLTVLKRFQRRQREEEQREKRGADAGEEVDEEVDEHELDADGGERLAGVAAAGAAELAAATPPPPRVESPHEWSERDISSEIELLKESNECPICLDRPINTSLAPCGHRVLCSVCAKALNERDAPSCPICRQEVWQFVESRPATLKRTAIGRDMLRSSSSAYGTWTCSTCTFAHNKFECRVCAQSGDDMADPAQMALLSTELRELRFRLFNSAAAAKDMLHVAPGDVGNTEFFDIVRDRLAELERTHGAVSAEQRIDPHFLGTPPPARRVVDGAKQRVNAKLAEFLARIPHLDTLMQEYEQRDCVICASRRINVTFSTCGHRILCDHCTEVYRKPHSSTAAAAAAAASSSSSSSSPSALASSSSLPICLICTSQIVLFTITYDA
jgi:Zinc finger, C3HC4 type (RING finger)